MVKVGRFAVPKPEPGVTYHFKYYCSPQMARKLLQGGFIPIDKTGGKTGSVVFLSTKPVSGEKVEMGPHIICFVQKGREKAVACVLTDLGEKEMKSVVWKGAITNTFLFPEKKNQVEAPAPEGVLVGVSS